MSAAHCTMFSGCSDICTVTGAFIAVTTMSDDEPMWRQITVPWSEHAAKNGSQCGSCHDGNPSFAGFSEKVIAWQPLAATRATSARHQLADPRCGGSASGMNRSGYAPHHSSMCQSLYAWSITSARSLSSVRGEQLAAELRERREAHRPEHAVRVHVHDARVDVVAAGSELVEARGVDAVAVRRTTGDRVQRDVGHLASVERPHVEAAVRPVLVRRHVARGRASARERARRTSPAAPPRGRRRSRAPGRRSWHCRHARHPHPRVRSRQPAFGPPLPTTATSGSSGTCRSPPSPQSWRTASCT